MSGAPMPAAGAAAAVRWVDGRFFLVRVIGPDPKGYRIAFADGQIETVPPNSLVSLVPPPMFRVGDQVLGVWREDRMYPGTVTAVLPQGYAVAWHDGDPPQVVPSGRLTYLAWASSAAQVPIELKPDFIDVTADVLPLPGSETLPEAEPLPAPQTASTTAAKPSFTISIPGSIMPIDRGRRYAEPLQDALDRQHAGKIVDEGTKVVQVNGRPMIEGCWITVEVSDPARALTAIRSTLRAANAPPGTTITDETGAVHNL